ncbi:hypothetical protein [Enterocloster lavalensis]|uniref:hypothetical protein n=1 Tax=Enterocloster lavalensis TaxID=460384 RepID=UPI0023EF892F|nr:hypothetical protein [Enterocloster lavalensis]
MKKSIFGKIGAAAVVLTLVTSSLVGGTFAKYATSVTGSASATVAKWNVTFKNGEGAFTKDSKIALTNKNEKLSVAADTIAPGSYGVMTLKVEGNDSQVGYSYKITADMADVNVPVKFYEYTNSTKGKECAKSGDSYTLADGSVKVTDATKDATVEIYWEWTDDGTQDVAHTELGSDPTTVKGEIPLTITAEQFVDTTTNESQPTQ